MTNRPAQTKNLRDVEVGETISFGTAARTGTVTSITEMSAGVMDVVLDGHTLTHGLLWDRVSVEAVQS
jgi:hypothetical protein